MLPEALAESFEEYAKVVRVTLQVLKLYGRVMIVSSRTAKQQSAIEGGGKSCETSSGGRRDDPFTESTRHQI